jgi:ParB family chromosome partitioning protein
MIIKVLPCELRDNPYQIRLARDPAKFAELKASIKEHGVLEKPIVRKDPKNTTSIHDSYQLAFGHGRRDAWASVRPGQPMDVELRPLTDQQMFEYSWDENHRREDLSPIEDALLLQKEATEFHLTQKQLAERHKNIKDQGSISNKLALLHLPDPVRMMVHRRELAERQARQLIPFAKISPKDVEQTAKRIVENSPNDCYTPEDMIDALYDKHAERINTYPGSLERKFLTWPRKPIKTDPEKRIKGAPDEIPPCNGCSFLRKHDGWTYCFRTACLQTKKNLHQAAERKAHPIHHEPAKPAPKERVVVNHREEYVAAAKKLINAAAPAFVEAVPKVNLDFIGLSLVNGRSYDADISPIKFKKAAAKEKRKLFAQYLVFLAVDHHRYDAKPPKGTERQLLQLAKLAHVRLPKGWNAAPAEPKKSKKTIIKTGLGSYTAARARIIKKEKSK